MPQYSTETNPVICLCMDNRQWTTNIGLMNQGEEMTQHGYSARPEHYGPTHNRHLIKHRYSMITLISEDLVRLELTEASCPHFNLSLDQCARRCLERQDAVPSSPRLVCAGQAHWSPGGRRCVSNGKPQATVWDLRADEKQMRQYSLPITGLQWWHVKHTIRHSPNRARTLSEWSKARARARAGGGALRLRPQQWGDTPAITHSKD